MIGLFIIAALVAAGTLAVDTATLRGWYISERKHVDRKGLPLKGTALATACAAASKRAGKVASARQVLFQVRAVLHGMPADGTYAAHECTADTDGRLLVAAALVDGGGHDVLIAGKPHKVAGFTGTGNERRAVMKPCAAGYYRSKAACIDAYCAARDCDYVVHSDACTPAHVAKRQGTMQQRLGGNTGKVAHNHMPAGKAESMHNSGK